MPSLSKAIAPIIGCKTDCVTRCEGLIRPVSASSPGKSAVRFSELLRTLSENYRLVQSQSDLREAARSCSGQSISALFFRSSRGRIDRKHEDTRVRRLRNSTTYCRSVACHYVAQDGLQRLRRRYKRPGRGRSTARADSRLSPRARACRLPFFLLLPSRRSQIRSGPFVSPIYVTRHGSSEGKAVSEEGEI